MARMDLSRFPRRCYTPFATPLEFLPRFSEALAASCPDGQVAASALVKLGRNSMGVANGV